MRRLTIIISTLVVLAAGCSDETSTTDLGTPDQGPLADQAVSHDGPTTPDSFWVPDSPAPDTALPDKGAQDGEAKPDKSPPQDLGPGQCKSPCDCPQGMTCPNGSCIAGTKPVYCCTNPGCPAGQPCVFANGTKGTCAGPGQCQTHCDCAQGLMCTGGMCIAGFVPVYCCPKPGCPTGQLCYNPDGSQGNCP